MSKAKGKKKPHQLTNSEFKKRVKSQIIRELEMTKQDAVSVYSLALAYSLHDKLGFGHKRVDRLLKQVAELFDSIDRGYVSLEDISGEVRDRLRININ